MEMSTAGLAAAVIIMTDIGSDGEVLGTGFLMETEAGGTYIVTNKHVADASRRSEAGHFHVRPAVPLEFEIGGQGKTSLVGMAIPGRLVVTPEEGDEIDLAVVRLPGRPVDRRLISWERRITRDEIMENGWWEGTRVLSMGYPGGILPEWATEKGRAWPSVRTGTIARMQDWLEGNTRTILIDGATLGGQSGSAVFLRPGDEGGQAGGPVFLSAEAHGGKPGRLLGVTYARWSERVGDQKEQSVDLHLQEVVPAIYLEALMKQADDKWRGWDPNNKEQQRAGAHA